MDATALSSQATLQKPWQAEHSVLYCSRATSLVTPDELDCITRVSQKNNTPRGISGLLVYGGGMFLQWLEGPRVEVQALMKTIAADPRHSFITTLKVIDSPHERLYTRWSMHNMPPATMRRTLNDFYVSTGDGEQRRTIRMLLDMLKTEPLAALMVDAGPDSVAPDSA